MLVIFASFCANPLSSGVRQERQMLAVFIGRLAGRVLLQLASTRGSEHFLHTAQIV